VITYFPRHNQILPVEKLQRDISCQRSSKPQNFVVNQEVKPKVSKLDSEERWVMEEEIIDETNKSHGKTYGTIT
jgi:hypothetical protein